MHNNLLLTIISPDTAYVKDDEHGCSTLNNFSKQI
jgi:hypothetical protein